jgi:murein L,D-transpeptidase YcbB/YkuD
MPGRLLAAAVAAMVLSTSCGKLPEVKQQSHQTQDARSIQALQALLNAKQTPGFVTRDREGARLWALVKQFYQKRGYEPAWIDGRSPRPQMDELITAAQHADREGLDPALYNVSALAARRRDADQGFLSKKGFNEAEAVGLDAWLTYVYMQYASDLAHGISDLAHADPAWQIRGQDLDPVAKLSDALEHNSVARSLDDLRPHDPQYESLRKALGQYRDLAAKGGWPALPANAKLKPGQHNAVVPALARRLAVTGDFTGKIGDTETVYGPGLQEAVKRFQRRHGLEPDGVIGPALVAQMNVPAAARVRQIELNLERWRWLPRDLGDRHIIVNIPEYRLEVWDHGRVPLAMKVVVGKKDNPTPVLADRMTTVVFSPYWNIPPEIVQKETLPHVLKDPAYLDKNNIEVVRASNNDEPVDVKSIDWDDADVATKVRFRQKPGAGNSLGLVKFIFPNHFNVYLHDTPAQALFSRIERDFSHGCVRVERPMDLAKYVLRDQASWTEEKIDEAMHSGQERSVALKEPLPVYLVYFTAWEENGTTKFGDDVYGYDRRQAVRN